MPNQSLNRTAEKAPPPVSSLLGVFKSQTESLQQLRLGLHRSVAIFPKWKQITVMKEKVYLDSTIPSYYFDQRESLAAFTEVTRYGIRYLLTWNCNHLANANKRKHIRIINGRLGLSTPEIITPLELFAEEAEL